MNDFKFNQAIRYYRQGLHDSSIDLLKELLAENPDDAYYHAYLGANLLAMKRIYAAEYELNLALSIDPGISQLYIFMAQVSIFRNRLVPALEFCDQSLALDPQNVDALLVKNDIYKRLDRNREALACIDQAAQIAPDSTTISVAYGQHYLSIGKLQQAHQHAADALRSHAEDISANLLMGEIQLAMNNTEEAEYHAKLVILSNPENQSALHLFSSIKMHKNRVFGLWWRFNIRVSSLSNLRSGLVLISAFLIFNLLSQIVKDLGYTTTAQVISYAWLLLVIYSWVGIPYYYKILRKELARFAFNPNY